MARESLKKVLITFVYQVTLIVSENGKNYYPQVL